MNHYFSVSIAEKCGVHSAIVFNYIAYWVGLNESDERNYYEGKYWMFNTKKAFAEVFPYMTERQIRYAIDKLIESGLIVSGSFNKKAFDHTLWYTLSDSAKTIEQFCPFDMTNLSNRTAENVNSSDNFVNSSDNFVKPIPVNILQLNKQQLNNNIISCENEKKTSRKADKIDYEKILNSYHELCPSLPKAVKLTERRKRAIKARLKDFSFDDLEKVFQKAEADSFLTGNNERKWKADFDYLMREDKFIRILEKGQTEKSDFELLGEMWKFAE